MKKFTSLFLVISITMWNLNSGVVEALSTCGNEVKEFVNRLADNRERKTVDVKEDKGLEKETVQEHINNDVDNTQVLDSKNKYEQVNRSSNKKVLISDDEGSIQEHVILFYNLEDNEFYYYNGFHNIQKMSLSNKRTNTNKIDLNDILKNNNLFKGNRIIDPQDVTLILVGSGSGREIYLDNQYPIPFNILFYNIDGQSCDFSFQNIRAMYVLGNNTIKNSSYGPALTYSFDGGDSQPLKIYNGSFIVYNDNEDKDSINNNILYLENGYENSEDDSDISGDESKNSGYPSVVNISFEDSISKEKKFMLQPVNNSNNTPKYFSTKVGYNVLSILLVSDNNDYILREEGGNETPYYYRSVNSDDDNGELEGQIRTQIRLSTNSTPNCYNISNKKRVEVAVDGIGDDKNYYLINSLEDAMNNGVDISDATVEFIFLGDYEITLEDIEAIKNYNKDIYKIVFKTKVDDWKYLLKVGKDIEFSIDNTNKFSISFEDIKFNYDSNDKWIYANGRKLTFGSGVEMVGQYYPSISSGKSSSIDSNIINEGSLIINSGTYEFVTGDRYSTLQNININIGGGTFKNRVSGVSNKSQDNDGVNDVALTIKGGTFIKEVIVVDGNIRGNATLNITSNNPTFKSNVLGVNTEGNISGSLKISIKGGSFINDVIGINGGTAKSVILTIDNGIFYGDVIGDALNYTTEKVTLKSLFNRYLFSDNMNINNNQVRRDSSDINYINISIKSGTFRDNLIGSSNRNCIINIDSSSITIPTISDFTKLVVGKVKKATSLKVYNIDKGHSTGDLCLNNGSKISFIKSGYTTKLNDIQLYGDKNTLILPTNAILTKDKVLIDLSGEVKTTNNNKLNININSNRITDSGMHLIRFEDKSKVDIENKYEILSKGYYIRDIIDEKDSSGYVVLYPQTIFDLEYDLQNNKLYMIKDGNREYAWWYDGNTQDVNNITLNTNKLYEYKGYDLYDYKNKKIRNIILTGKSSNKNIVVNDNLNNINVELKNVNLTNSKINLNDLKSLTLNGKNIIYNINANQDNINKDIFTYNFNDEKISDKVLFKDNNSYLNIFTDGDTNPFSGCEEDRIDFKFFKPFEKNNILRLNNNVTRYKFEIPKGTQRLGVLVDGSHNDKVYKLYDGELGETGSSVYVAGRKNDTFTDEFEISKSYEDVRRANPVNKIDIEMPSQIYFSIDVDRDKLNSPKEINWQNHFRVTKMKVKNNSSVVQDLFIDENEEAHEFVAKGKKNPNLEFGYMGVSSTVDTNNDIKLVSKGELDPFVETDNTLGLKLALKLGDTEINESVGVLKTPLRTWDIPYNKEETIDIKPNFTDNGNFFNISKNTISTFKLNSSHKFTFRFGLKQ